MGSHAHAFGQQGGADQQRVTGNSSIAIALNVQVREVEADGGLSILLPFRAEDRALLWIGIIMKSWKGMPSMRCGVTHHSYKVSSSAVVS